LLTLDELKTSGIWPTNKPFTEKTGENELKELGLEMFYSGKNGDLYLIPDTTKDVALLMRSDRVSVFDIPINDIVEGKGKIQNSISTLGANYAKNMGLKTAVDFDYKIENLPEKFKQRSQVIELCRPFEVEIDEEIVQLELIFRNYLTGSLYKAYKSGNDPYNLKLKDGLQEWHKFDTPIFTPTTKGTTDEPLNGHKVALKIPEITKAMENLFISFTKYADSKGITVIDTKFEVFLNANGDWILGDEILTPESSRFIMSSDFQAGSYKSMDKQIIRNHAIKDGWKERWVSEKEVNPNKKFLEASIPSDIKKEVIKGYEYICSLLKD
jgi:phosphoribosylaminoimidazole-succinocarboxamide synthase